MQFCSHHEQLSFYLFRLVPIIRVVQPGLLLNDASSPLLPPFHRFFFKAAAYHASLSEGLARIAILFEIKESAPAKEHLLWHSPSTSAFEGTVPRARLVKLVDKKQISAAHICSLEVGSGSSILGMNCIPNALPTYCISFPHNPLFSHTPPSQQSTANTTHITSPNGSACPSPMLPLSNLFQPIDCLQRERL